MGFDTDFMGFDGKLRKHHGISWDFLEVDGHL